MQSSSIEAIKNEYDELTAYLRENGQPTFEIAVNNSYRKNLILSAASFFEAEITTEILNYARICANDDVKLISFIDKKALARQYHTLFDWESKNCNRFFKWFGEAAKDSARKQIEDKKLEQAEQDFLSIGLERNRLVHQNFVDVVLNDTLEDIYKKYKSAILFIEFIQKFLGTNPDGT